MKHLLNFILLIVALSLNACVISSSTEKGKIRVNLEDLSGKASSTKTLVYVNDQLESYKSKECSDRNKLTLDWLGRQRKDSKDNFQDSPEYKEYMSCVEENMSQNEKLPLNYLAKVLIRRSLISEGGYLVSLSKFTHTKPKYQVNVRVTELIPDIEEARKKNQDLDKSLGYILQSSLPYVGVAAVPIIAPLGGLLMGFDVITGIPTKYSKEIKRGLIAAEVSVLDFQSGQILLSFPSRALFISSKKELGDEYTGSHNHSNKISTSKDALEVAIQEAIKKIKKDLN